VKADDPRHGRRSGYQDGCRCDPCSLANYRYGKRWEAEQSRGYTRTVPIIGSQRRSQALERLGWSMRYQSMTVGRSPRWVENALYLNTSGRIHIRNHELFAALYDEHSMRLPPQTRSARAVVNRAQRLGYIPPLAWDDGRIDDPDYQPHAGSNRRHRDDVDDAVVLRVLSGERLDTTTAERAEIVRRWLASGRSERQLCQITGWRMGRYTEREDVA
jgi:hypothetical protein